MFENREEAGKLLAKKLKKVIRGKNFVVVALLRGGIVLGKVVADHFKTPLKPLAVKKIGSPYNEELAIGAVTYDKTHYLNEEIIKYLQVDKEYIDKVLDSKWRQAQDFQNKFNQTGISLKGKRVVIVDDGIATGTTAICAALLAKKEKAKEIILAAPIIARDSLRNLNKYFDTVISLKTVENLSSVSEFYRNFPQVEEEEVFKYLK